MDFEEKEGVPKRSLIVALMERIPFGIYFVL